MLALLVMTRWWPPNDLPFVIRDKKGRVVLVESSFVFRGRVSIWHFLIGGVFILFEGCSEVYMYFSFLSLHTASCTPFLWPFMTYIVLYFYIYDDVCFSSPISTCVVFFLSLYTYFFTYAIIIYVSHMMPWWVLFKCFRKTGCKSLPCHELSSYKVFQEFMLDFFFFFFFVFQQVVMSLVI